jgi:hypothetical protein
MADVVITNKPDSPYLVYMRNKKRPLCYNILSKAGETHHTKTKNA